MASSEGDIKKHVRLYLLIGFLLIVGTVITVLVAKLLDFGVEGTSTADIIVGLIIAASKVTLVLVVYMHLKWEKMLIYKILVMTVVFFISLYLLTWLAYVDPIGFIEESFKFYG